MGTVEFVTMSTPQARSPLSKKRDPVEAEDAYWNTADGQRERSISIRNFPTWVPEWLHTWWLSYAAILVWYGFNLTMVLSGKFIFATMRPPPAALTTLHVTTGFVLSSIVLHIRGPSEAAKAEVTGSRLKQFKDFALPAICFALNIYLSNLCTQLSNNASFTATIKALTPVVTFVLYAGIAGRVTPGWKLQVTAIAVVIAGVLLNASADSQWTWPALITGFAATGACAMMAITQTKSLQKQDPIVGMNAQAPTVIMCLLAITLCTETERVQLWWLSADWSSVLVLLCHGLLAFMLNIVGTACAAVTKPVQKTIFGNLKVCFIYVLECAMWQGCVMTGAQEWGAENKLKKEFELWAIIGCLIIFGGALWYGYLYEQEKNSVPQQKKRN